LKIRAAMIASARPESSASATRAKMFTARAPSLVRMPKPKRTLTCQPKFLGAGRRLGADICQR
jgi:hypothetical protein